MGKHKAVEVDTKEIERAQNMWAGFTNLMKWSVIATVAVLVLLALIFI